MNIDQAIPYVRSKGLEFIETFECLQLSLKGFSISLSRHIDKMDALWKEAQALEIEENEATIITVYQLMNWFFFPEGEPIMFRPEAGADAEEDYNQLLLNLLYDRSKGHYPSVEWAGAFMFAKMRRPDKINGDWKRKWPTNDEQLVDAIGVVSDYGILFLRSFERYYDCAYGNPESTKLERETKIMQDLWETAATMEAEFDSVPKRQLLNVELVDWFFTACGDPEDLMLDCRPDKESKYNRFCFSLLSRRQDGSGLDVKAVLDDVFDVPKNGLAVK